MHPKQQHRRYLRALFSVVLLAALLTGCGSGQNSARGRGESAKSQSVEAVEARVEAANQRVLQAARSRDRPALAQAERSLTALRKREDAVEGAPDQPSTDPFERELDRFEFKQAPLFVQQITSSENDRVLYTSVFRPQFCLKTPAERLDVVRQVYLPVNARLRRQ